MTYIRRILATFRKPQQSAPVKWINPKSWTPLGKRLVGIHISDASRR